MSRVPAYWGNGDTILRFGEGLTAEDEAESGGAADGVELPGWLRARAAPEAAATPLRPSAAGVVRQGEAKRMLGGRLAHALLQMLPDVPRGLRAAAAKAHLDAHGGALADETRAALLAQVAAVVEAPEFAHLFGPGSRGEVGRASCRERV